MLDKVEGSKRAGMFTLTPDRSLFGELTFEGSKTSLYLQDPEFFNARAISDRYLCGVLHDLTKVSLLGCVVSRMGTVSTRDESYHYANIFPHFVVHGEQHVRPDEKVIAEAHFLVDDASVLFCDFDAFGHLIDARPFIQEIAHANNFARPVSIGPDPQILYFTGKCQIFAVETVLGRVDASHSPIPDFGGPEGVGLKNRIFVTVTFKERAKFEDAISSTLALIRFLGILVGRPQNLLSLGLRIGETHEHPVFLRVYWSSPPRRDPSGESEKPHSSDVLVDAVSAPEQFSSVLKRWLEKEDEWHDARLRFDNSFTKQRRYDIDRLIGSANMFDILPDSATPPDAPLTDELKAAKESCREIFTSLTPSPERDSILSALGRIGKSSLKHKIRHRAQFLTAVAGSRFNEITLVIDEAVNCRNHYVHGGAARFDYNRNFDVVIFFMDTLEFVFATSDLIESGWDFQTWSETPTTMSHAFAAFRVTYPERLQKLKSLLP